MSIMCRTHGLLARCLARAINTERGHRIVFHIGPALQSVEHVICRKLHDRNSVVRSRARNVPCTILVDRVSRCRIGLSSINCRIGSCVDHGVATARPDRLIDLGRLGNVRVFARKTKDVHAIETGKSA